MKKLIGLFFAFIAIFVMVSCGNKKGDSTNNNVTRLDAPVLTLTDNVVTWDAVENAGGYVVKVNDSVSEEQTETSYTITVTEAGEYRITVKAVPTDTTLYKESYYSEEVVYTKKNLSATTVYIVGDSTVCDYGKYDGNGNKTGVTDTTYFYDRYGYGTQFYNYFSSLVTFNNLAMSGRSALSFIKEDNYATLTTKIKAGDYLVIGFGHNDEKFDDADRFADPSLSTETANSFKNILYNKYIKVAEDAGATAILDTPIVRYSDTLDFTGSKGHKVTLTSDDITKFGSTTLAGHSVGDVLDYPKAIKELGEEKNVEVVDLTTLTATLYTSLGADEAKYLHAVTSGNSETEPNFKSIDATHINILGAKHVAYLFANAIKNSNSSLKNYVNATLTAPNRANDLVKNPYYEYVPYSAMDLDAWATLVENGYDKDDSTHITLTANYGTITDGWYGTAFGDVGGDPLSPDTGYYATETSAGVFKVGQSKSSATYYKGKIASTSEGYAFAFRRVSVSKNFTLSASGTITAQNSDGKQSGFGLMLRDDCYAPVNNSGICSNNICAGIWQEKVGNNHVGYARESTSLVKSGKTSTLTPAVGTTIECTIARVGQVVTTTIVYNGETYISTYTDFDLVARDSEYMYIGMYGARGIICEWTNVSFAITGDSQGA